jgi:hypothetical protein
MFAVTDEKGLTTEDKVIVTATEAPNLPPTANAQIVILDEDTSKTITLSGGDADGDALTYTVVTPPSHGTFDGTTYIPDANYFGNDSFAFKANDGEVDSAVAVVSIDIKEKIIENPYADYKIAKGPIPTDDEVKIHGQYKVRAIVDYKPEIVKTSQDIYGVYGSFEGEKVFLKLNEFYPVGTKVVVEALLGDDVVARSNEIVIQSGTRASSFGSLEIE